MKLVSMTPGAMAFTLIFGANSLANPLVKTSTAPFEAAYNVMVGRSGSYCCGRNVNN